MSDKSNWKNKNRDILLKNLPSWDKDANVLPVLKREAIDAEKNRFARRPIIKKKKKGRK